MRGPPVTYVLDSAQARTRAHKKHTRDSRNHKTSCVGVWNQPENEGRRPEKIRIEAGLGRAPRQDRLNLTEGVPWHWDPCGASRRASSIGSWLRDRRGPCRSLVRPNPRPSTLVPGGPCPNTSPRAYGTPLRLER